MGVLIKSIYAGLMIGLGGTVYLSVENKIVGAVLFSFGLLTIVNQKFYLYTGKVGYENELSKLFKIAIGNLIGTLIIAILIRFSKQELIEKATLLWSNKMNYNARQLIVLPSLCGVMMYLAVDNYSKNNHLLYIILPVVMFILCGFEHSIANMYYMFLSGNINASSVMFVFNCVVWNACGAKCFHLIKKMVE